MSKRLKYRQLKTEQANQVERILGANADPWNFDYIVDNRGNVTEAVQIREEESSAVQDRLLESRRGGYDGR